MRRFFFLLSAALVAGCAVVTGAQPARAGATLCVGGSQGCFSTLQAAIDAAHDGDRITIAPGTFAGGVTVDVSVDIRGAGAGATTIAGGGPVLTLGKEFAPSEPTISISGVTITGGVNTSAPDHAVTQGGGVRIPQAAGLTTGATVTIRDSVITGNTVYSVQFLPAGFCGPIDCSFASGGGISNDGTLTLTDTRVTDNQAGAQGSRTVVAIGGGIVTTQRGSLTLEHSVVSGNRALGTPPYGARADAGGINAFGPVVIEDSVLSDNSAELTSTLATNDFGPNSIAGGLHIAEGASGTVTRTIFEGNRSDAAGSNADLVVGGVGAIDDDGTLTLVDSVVAHNEGSATASAPSATALAGGGGMDIDGIATIRDSRFVANSGTSSAPHGTAIAGGGAISNFGQTTIGRTVIAANRVTAIGIAGSAQGGGIGNFGFGTTPSLALTDSTVAGNAVGGSPGVTLQGGGLFTMFPVTLTRTVVAGNRPDQCFGC
jgi:hypothetical protein